jgi:hypothetical protein
MELLAVLPIVSMIILGCAGLEEKSKNLLLNTIFQEISAEGGKCGVYLTDIKVIIK